MKKVYFICVLLALSLFANAHRGHGKKFKHVTWRHHHAKVKHKHHIRKYRHRSPRHFIIGSNRSYKRHFGYYPKRRIDWHRRSILGLGYGWRNKHYRRGHFGYIRYYPKRKRAILHCHVDKYGRTYSHRHYSPHIHHSHTHPYRYFEVDMPRSSFGKVYFNFRY